MNNSHVIFAVNQKDAAAMCGELGLKFAETTWVLNYQLLGGDFDPMSHIPHFTESFKMFPAYREAAFRFGIDPDE